MDTAPVAMIDNASGKGIRVSDERIACLGVQGTQKLWSTHLVTARDHPPRSRSEHAVTGLFPGDGECNAGHQINRVIARASKPKLPHQVFLPANFRVDPMFANSLDNAQREENPPIEVRDRHPTLEASNLRVWFATTALGSKPLDLNLRSGPRERLPVSEPPSSTVNILQAKQSIVPINTSSP